MTSKFGVLLRCGLFLLIAARFSAAEEPFKKKAEPKAESPNAQVFEGQVLQLADVVKPQSPAADEDGLKNSRVLKGTDGKVYSLVKDKASRKFFLDNELLRRPMKITAEQIPGTQMLLVVKVQSIIGGVLHDVDYWCETCQLSYTEPGVCKCCGNFVELRELPVEP